MGGRASNDNFDKNSTAFDQFLCFLKFSMESLSTRFNLVKGQVLPDLRQSRFVHPVHGLFGYSVLTCDLGYHLFVGSLNHFTSHILTVTK